MKKLLLIGLLVLGAVSFGRDMEYRERKEFEVLQSRAEESWSRTPRERCLHSNKEKSFLSEIQNMNRGSENN